MVDLGEPRDCQLLRSKKGAITDMDWNADQWDVNVMGCRLAGGMGSLALSSSWEDPRGWRRRPTRTHGGVLHFSFAVPEGKEVNMKCGWSAHQPIDPQRS